MPKATAVWLVENTVLTFDQIADFCGMHPLEVQAIADGEGGAMVGVDPVANGQISADELDRAQKDPQVPLKLLKSSLPQPKSRTGGPRYTPVARRGDKPDAIAWLLKHVPAIKDNQVGKLIGTTKQTIEAVRSKSHWNSPNIKPQNPVLLGLCTQRELNELLVKIQEESGSGAISLEAMDSGADPEETGDKMDPFAGVFASVLGDGGNGSSEDGSQY